MTDVSGHDARITRVESEVELIRNDLGGIKQDMSGVKASMRGFGDILTRIEQSVQAAQDRHDHEKQASRLNPIAFATVIITLISIIVGGAWLISGGLATTATRLDDNDRATAQLISMRDREFNQIQRRLDKLEGGQHSGHAAEQSDQQ